MSETEQTKKVARTNNRDRCLTKLEGKSRNEKMSIIYDWIKHQGLSCKNMIFLINNIDKET